MKFRKMKKEFIHKKNENCLLCNKEIDTSKNEWAVIIDLNGKKQIAVKFYHKRCLVDLFEGKGKIIQKKFEEKLGNFTKKMFGGVDINQTNFGLGLKQLIE